MGKKLGAVALLVGAFLLVLAALSKFYMYDRLAVAPLNNETTSVSETAPDAPGTYLDVAGGLEEVTSPLKSTRVVAGDVKLSKQASKELDRDVAVWDTYSCTDKPDFDCGSAETPLSGTHDLVAFDVRTGETVDWDGSYTESDGDKKQPAGFEGLYFKFPFDTQKKTYPFWDGTLGEATDAEYTGEKTLDGLKVYTFEQVIEPTKVGTIDVPGDLVGSDEATVTADQVYSNTRSFSVEPTTGVIIVGGEQQDNYLEYEGTKGATTTKATLQYTDANTQATVDEYKPKAQLLSLVKTTFPIGGGIVGLLLIGLGVFLRRGRNDGGSAHAADKPLVGASQ